MRDGKSGNTGQHLNPKANNDGNQNTGISRRGFLGSMGGAAALHSLPFAALGQQPTIHSYPRGHCQAISGPAHPTGLPLRVKPALVYRVPEPADKTSWRMYGDIKTDQAANKEKQRLQQEIQQLQAQSDFPMEFMSFDMVKTPQGLKKLVATDCDVILMFAAGGLPKWFRDVEYKAPILMFVRHKSGPFYLWYECAHWLFLRQKGDTIMPGYDTNDVVVDDYNEVLWRLRAFSGLKNAKGTTMLAIGGLDAYSDLADEFGPKMAKDVWGYDIKNVSNEEFMRRLNQARNDASKIQTAERQADELLAMRNVSSVIDRKYVVETYLILNICKQLIKETGAGYRANFGFARCMDTHIKMLGIAPCLVLGLANDEGYTAYCHTDLSHTLPGVLLRWIANRPAFLCNSHYPHNGIMTVAHCAAPRKLNGKDYEPTTITTHYESDWPTADRVDYRVGQTVTAIISNLHCNKWFGFRARIKEIPCFPACRTQMELEIDGDWRGLLAEMEGFHTQIVYGDYLREVGYALKKLGGQIEWHCYSETV